MDIFHIYVNCTVANTPYGDAHVKVKILSDIQRQIIMVLNYVFLCGLIGLMGVTTNVTNLVVFYKQGLNSSMNITFFSMAISDLCGLLLQQWFNVCVNPLFEASDLPMVPSEFQYMTGGVPRVIFSKITCLITVYATLERCLCIAFPLHVKQMITPIRATLIMFGIYCLIFVSVAPLYCITYIDWKFYPGKNKTLLGLVYASNSERIEEMVYIMQACIGAMSFLGVVVFTAILIKELREKNTWRKSVNADRVKSESMINRDRKTMSMVVLIAIILIVCYTPGIILFVVTFFEPEFSVMGRYTNLFLSMWSIACLFETTNSSVNIFLYLKMSTKYRQTFRALFVACNRKTEVEAHILDTSPPPLNYQT